MRISWRGALGFGLSAALLYWAFRNVTWSDIGTQFRASDPLLWIVAIVASQCIFPLRAWRWRTILHTVAPDIPYRPLWRSTAIGMMANNVLPARLGEVARAYSLARAEPRVPFTAALTSLVVDRACDALVLLALLLLALVDPTYVPAAGATAGTPHAVIVSLVTVVVGAFAALYFTVLWPERMEALAARVTRAVAPRFEPRIRILVHSFAAGLGVLRRPADFAVVMAWTVAHWVLNGVAFWVGFRAVGINVPFSAGLFVQGVIAAAVALPSMPAFIGIFEASAIVALARYGVTQSDALGWALAYHGLTLVPITLIGVWYVARAGISWGDLRHVPSQSTAQ